MAAFTGIAAAAFANLVADIFAVILVVVKYIKRYSNPITPDLRVTDIALDVDPDSDPDSNISILNSISTPRSIIMQPKIPLALAGVFAMPAAAAPVSELSARATTLFKLCRGYNFQDCWDAPTTIGNCSKYRLTKVLESAA